MAKIKGTSSDDRIVPSGSTPPAGNKKDDVSVPLAANTINGGNDKDTINNTEGSIVSFGNTPQAKDDRFTPAALTEDSLGTVILDVMGNDLGGAAKRLWSLDGGTSPGGIRPTDLLTQDPVGAANVSANGATIKITADGKVSYDASTLSSAFTNTLQTLGAGEFATDTFTYAIRLANGALSWATATVQIAGVNVAPVLNPTVSIADGLPNPATEGTDPSISFTVSLSGPADENTLVTYSTVNGTAVAGSDFTGATGATVTILAGATTATITIPVLNDSVFETPEAFTVHLSAAELDVSNEPLAITDADGTGNIVDNDAAPAFSINDVTVSETAGTITFTVTKAGATAGTSTVNYAVTPDTAVTPGDYAAGTSALSDTLTFLAGDTSKTITLNITNDAIFELTETFNVDLSGPTNEVTGRIWW